MEINMKEVISSAFTQYSGAVLQSRALVDVRDCIKPSARQIFYCLYTDKFLPTKPFKKTLKAIGSSARMYIHGDSSCEGVIMRASQPFALRYPLIEVEGNNGNLISSGNWAAPRYSSSRLSELSTTLFADINKDTVEEWRDNYDDTEKYPSVLPSKGFYNIVNGTSGIGIGLASSIPQFNIKDVNKALETLLLNPNCDFNDIYCQPDFATGAILLNEEEVKESLRNGGGKACKLRSVIEWNPDEKCLIVTEIPYGTYTNTIAQELESIIEDEVNNPGIDRFNDLTGESPLIKIYLTKRGNPNKVLKYLYKNTSLQNHYGINMTMLDNGRFPKVFSWKEALTAHINHEKIVYRRGFEYDLSKIEKRIHILDGMLICVSAIDEVIALIKASRSTAEASAALQNTFSLDEEQAKAVLAIKLSSLAKLEVEKLQHEKETLTEEANKIRDVLNNEEKFNRQLINGWRENAEKYGDSHRTKIMNMESDDEEETVEKKNIQLSLSNLNNVYCNETSNLYVSKRNRAGDKFKLANGEYITTSITCETTNTITFFSTKGNMYALTASSLPLEEKINLTSLLTLKEENEDICAATVLDRSKNYVLFVTKNGMIKKSKLEEYKTLRKIGVKALTLVEDDEIIGVFFMDYEKIGVCTHNGRLMITETSTINPIGKIARGIKGIKLDDGDYVVAAHLIPQNTKRIASVTEKGYCKCSELSEFRVTATGTKGTPIQKFYEGDFAVDFYPIADEKEVIFVSSKSKLKVKVDEIGINYRNTYGSKSLKLNGEDRVIALLG